MQVKKFEAPTMAEALKLIKMELGPEAIILSTKKNKQGFGLLSKASVEVTAAVSEKSLAKKQLTERLVKPETRDRIQRLPAGKQAAIYDEFDEHYTERRRGIAQDKARAAATAAIGGRQRYIEIEDSQDSAKRATSDGDREGQSARHGAPTSYSRNGRMAHVSDDSDRSAAYQRARTMPAYVEPEDERDKEQASPSASAAPVAALQEELRRMKGMLEELKSEQTALTDARIPEVTSDAAQAEFNNLLRNGIEKRLATQLIKDVTQGLSREDASSSDRIVEGLAVEIMNQVKIEEVLEATSGGIKAGPDRQRVVALIGPTGVGKTTTIAKLASQAILNRNLRVGLINVDVYKVAALDQLATYAKILNVPFRQASTPAELDRALAEFKPLDLVLIDTTGRSQRDSESLNQMRSLLAACSAVRPLLIMSATTRDQELYDIVTRFKIFNPAGIVFSKLDESATFGSIYNVSVKTGLPLTYFTVGQRVPEDIEAASRERVASLILDL